MDSVSLVSLTIILSSVICEPNGETRNPLNRIFYDIYDANKGKNLVVATFPFRLAFCRLAAVASSETKQEIITLLGFTLDNQIKTCLSSVSLVLSKAMETDLTFLNKIYVNYTSDIDNSFFTDAQNYGVTVSKIGFNYNQAATSFVNKEFDSKTLKRVRDVLETRDIDGNSSLLLINGMHFKVTWENHFALEHTQKKIFRSNSKTSEVMMMNQIQFCMYLDDSKRFFKAVTLRTIGYGISVMFAIPYPTSSLDSLIAILKENRKSLSDIWKSMKWENVNISLPRFKIKTGMDWTHYLKTTGLNLTTSKENTGLNSILKNKKASNVYVSKAKQKVFIQVDEMGSVRPVKEPIGSIRDVERELPEENYNVFPEFVANRPFLFLVGMAKDPGSKDSPIVEMISGVYNGPED